MDWKPIETCPAHIEQPSLVLVGRKDWLQPDLAFRRNGQWWSATNHDGFVFAKLDPTHWMPLPKPPNGS
jgi:hypothetical protein